MQPLPPRPPSSIRFRRAVDLFVVIAFALATIAPVGMALAGMARFDPSVENRPATPWPEPEQAPLATWPSRFERWFGDRFGFRRTLIRWQSLARLRLGAAPSPQVLVGRDGWLFYRGERALESFQRTAPLSPEELEVWRRRLEQRRDWLAARGIRYLFAVAPNKESIYPELMPPRYQRREGPSRLEQLLAHLRHTSTVELVDLPAAVRGARARGRLYHLTDTHWNDQGAFAAYQALALRLAAWFPAVAPLTPGELTESRAVTLGGDLAGMMSLRTELPEEWLSAAPRSPRSAEAEPGVPVPPKTPPHAVPRARAVTDPRLPRALVLRDSFAEALIPFLSEHFERVLFLFTHRLDPEIVGREQPDVVVEEMLERYLMAAPFEDQPELALSAKSP